MPIYEYKCNTCGHRFDALRSMKEADAPIQCEGCASENMKRTISLFNAVSNSGAITQSTPSCVGCAATSCNTCGK